MRKSSPPSDLLPPLAAMAWWRELRPDAPESERALHDRLARLSVPRHLVNRRRHYSASEMRDALLGSRAARAVRLAGVLERATDMDCDVDIHTPTIQGQCLVKIRRPAARGEDFAIWTRLDQTWMPWAEEWLDAEAARRAEADE